MEGPVQHESDYISRKAEYQKKLVDNYMDRTIKVASLPLQPENNQTDVNNLYVDPEMTIDIWDETSRQTKEFPIPLHKMFHNVDTPPRNIYVLGEAGSGKSTLCKMLMYYWCVAHSVNRDDQVETIESNIYRVMKNYDFLFYVSLRHNQTHHKIETMIGEVYPDPDPDLTLKTILQNESDKCLILLDGLDEWLPENQRPSQHFTLGLPTRDWYSKYTIITTTRRWKFDTLSIKNSEIDKKIKLKGINETAIIELTERTVKTLNEKSSKHSYKPAEAFLYALNRSPVADLRHVPMVLQQLICLWHDDLLLKTSKCAVYSSMLELFFKWRELKHLENLDASVPTKDEISSRLPKYVNQYTACSKNKRVIYHLSRLAYTTLFGRNKETSLTFSDSTFENLNIPGDVVKFSVKVGILSEENIISFASKPQQTSFSFIHKSGQEFLAAIYVAYQIDKTENCEQFVRNHFGDCKTVADILEQTNVFIMLCGLEPHLLPYISYYIYSISKVDTHITEENKVLNDDDCLGYEGLRLNIQKCILDCVSEALSSGNTFKNNVYIADIMIICKAVKSYLKRQLFNLSKVLSLEIFVYRHDKKDISSVLKVLTECNSLKTLKYNGEMAGRIGQQTIRIGQQTIRIEQQTAKIIARNKTTLETISCIGVTNDKVKLLIKIIPDMPHLVSLQVSEVTLPPEVCRSMCKVLQQLVYLQQISLNIDSSKHVLNLQKHKQLQYLDIKEGDIYVKGVCPDNLDRCWLQTETPVMTEHVCASLCNASKLNELAITGMSHITSLSHTADNEKVTNCIERMLRSLTSLSTVVLEGFIFTDNIITHPSEMKNLKTIRLSYVTMSLRTWCEFIDRLPELPNSVHVNTDDMKIRDTRETHVEEAQHYVCNKTEFFHVLHVQDVHHFEFVTRKVGL